MEPIIHFAIPFAMLLIFGVDVKKALPISMLALVPDFDALFLVHRSFSHSLPVILAAFALASPLIWKFKAQKIAILAFLAVSSHLFLDLFSGFTPIMWPFYGYSIDIVIDLMVNMGNSTSLSFHNEILTQPISFDRFEDMTSPLFTGNGLIVSAVLLTISIYAVLKLRLNNKNKLGQ